MLTSSVRSLLACPLPDANFLDVSLEVEWDLHHQRAPYDAARAKSI
jgi:hypothetical protein